MESCSSEVVEIFNALIGQVFTDLSTPVGALFMNTQVALKYIGYARKSSEDNKERQAASLPDQLYIIDGLKDKLGLKIKDVLQESKSAHTPEQRDAFKGMVEAIKSGEANAIVTWHANRLARNPVDGGYIIFLMDSGKLLEIVTPSRTYHNTPEDKFMLGLEFSLSKKDSDDKSIVVSRGLEKKCRDGWRPGWAPIGYLNDKRTESGFRKIYVDQERLPFVKKIFELFLAGNSVRAIHRTACKEWHLMTRQHKRIGGHLLSESEIYRILNNPFYCGRFEYPVDSGKWHNNNPGLERVISEEVFNQVQVKLGNVSQKTTSHNYAYGHTLRCGNCGSGVVIDGKWQVICSRCRKKFQLTRKNPDRCPQCSLLIAEMPQSRISHYIYHRCHRHTDTSCKELSVSEKQLEKQIDRRLAEVELNPKFLEWAIEQIRRMHEDEKGFRESTIEATKNAYDDARKRLDNLVALKISPGNSDGSLLNDEEFKSRKVPLEEEIRNIESQLTNIDDRMIRANNKTVEAITFAAEAREKFNNTTDPKVKRDIFVGLCGSHPTLLDKTVNFDAPFYFEKIVEMKKSAPMIGKMVASNDWSLDITKSGDFLVAVPTLLRGRRSHPDRQIMHLPILR
ncbi:MAG: recombinase family protein [Patescibacteria group bacterium]|nr:recombinase family protein [Patescibacteria group bacterium]